MGSFVVPLLIIGFSPFLVMIKMCSIIKGEGIVKKNVLSSWMTRVGTHMLR